MLFSSQAYLAALNALLVEHRLGYVELIPQNPFAAELKSGMISALRKAARIPFDEHGWISKFNRAARVVQLNFIALGFADLGMRPLLRGENWQLVRDPFAIRNIERKLNKADRYVERRHGRNIHLRRPELSLEHWGLSDSAAAIAEGPPEAFLKHARFQLEPVPPPDGRRHFPRDGADRPSFGAP